MERTGFRLKAALTVLILMIIVLPAWGVAAKNGETPKVRIGYVSNGKNFPDGLLGIALEKGYLKKELGKLKIQAELIPFVGAGPAINEGLASKNLDLGSYGDTPAIIGKASGIETTLIAAGGTANDTAIIVPPDSPIKTVKDLVGKKVATMKGSYMHRTLVEILKSYNLTVRDIEFYHMTAPEAEAALIAKRVEAIVSPNTTYARIVIGNQGRVIINCANHPEWKGQGGILARTDYAKRNPKVIIALLKALIQAEKYANAHPEETKRIWTKTGFSKEIYDYVYPNNQFDFELELSDSYLRHLTYAKDFLKAEGLIRQDVNIKAWADRSFYQKAKDR